MNGGAKNPYLEALGRFSTVRHLDNNPIGKRIMTLHSLYGLNVTGGVPWTNLTNIRLPLILLPSCPFPLKIITGEFQKK